MHMCPYYADFHGGMYLFACMEKSVHYQIEVIMEYGSTPYVGLTRKKHGRHTLAQILFSSEN